MNKSPQYNQQSKYEVEEICIYQNMESVRHTHSIYSYLKINSLWVPCQKESQAKISESSQVQWSLIQKKRIYVNDHAAYITHWTHHPVHDKKVLILNIRQKLGFRLGVTDISNLPAVCIKLLRVAGWIYHSCVKIGQMKDQFLLKSYLILRKKY